MKAIADRVGIPKVTVGVTIKKFKERGHNLTLPMSGRPRKWKPRDDRLFVRETLKRPFLSWKELSSELNGVPVGQLKKTAYRNGIHRRIAFSKPYLTARHKQNRLRCARENLTTDWKKVLFTDESAVEIGKRPGRTFVSRQKNTRNELGNMVPNHHYTRFSIMVWAGIAYNLKMELLVIPLAKRRMPSLAEHRANHPNADPLPPRVPIPAETFTSKKYQDLVIDGPIKEYTSPFELALVEDGSMIQMARK